MKITIISLCLFLICACQEEKKIQVREPLKKESTEKISRLYPSVELSVQQKSAQLELFLTEETLGSLYFPTGNQKAEMTPEIAQKFLHRYIKKIILFDKNSCQFNDDGKLKFKIDCEQEISGKYLSLTIGRYFPNMKEIYIIQGEQQQVLLKGIGSFLIN